MDGVIHGDKSDIICDDNSKLLLLLLLRGKGKNKNTGNLLLAYTYISSPDTLVADLFYSNLIPFSKGCPSIEEDVCLIGLWASDDIFFRTSSKWGPDISFL